MKENIKLDFQTLINFAKCFGEEEEECWGNLEHAYNVLYNDEEPMNDLFSPDRNNNEYVIGIIGCAGDYAYDDKLQFEVRAFYKKVYKVLLE